MERKYLAFVLSLSFLFLFYSSSFVFGEEPEVKKELWENGKKRLEEHYRDGKLDGLSTYFYENGVKMFEVYYKHGKKMVLRLIGIQMGRHGMNDITNLEKKMALGLSGIITNR